MNRILILSDKLTRVDKEFEKANLEKTSNEIEVETRSMLEMLERTGKLQNLPDGFDSTTPVLLDMRPRDKEETKGIIIPINFLCQAAANVKNCFSKNIFCLCSNNNFYDILRYENKFNVRFVGIGTAFSIDFETGGHMMSGLNWSEVFRVINRSLESEPVTVIL